MTKFLKIKNWQLNVYLLNPSSSISRFTLSSNSRVCTAKFALPLWSNGFPLLFSSQTNNSKFLTFANRVTLYCTALSASYSSDPTCVWAIPRPSLFSSIFSLVIFLWTRAEKEPFSAFGGSRTLRSSAIASGPVDRRRLELLTSSLQTRRTTRCASGPSM